MKKIFSIILMFTFMINIQAATAIKNYDETVDVTKEYINDFENNSKYIILKQEMNIPFIFKNGKVEYSNVFNGNGGLLNEEEYNIGKGYLYNGFDFWLISNNSDYKIINSKGQIEKVDSKIKSGIRVTEFVKNTAKITGEGTRENPWEFVKRQYEVKIVAENGTVAKSPLYISEGNSDGVTVTGDDGCVFENISCTNEQKALYENGKMMITNVTKETVCKIKFLKIENVLPSKDGEYKVPATGYYLLEAYGAQGSGNGGNGGYVSAKFYLMKGQILKYRIGTTTNGAASNGSNSYSGGGASRYQVDGKYILIAAGGGGGSTGTDGGNNDSSGGINTRNTSVNGIAGTNGDGGSSAGSVYACTNYGTCGGGCLKYETKTTKTCTKYAPTSTKCAHGETECGDMFCDSLSGTAKSDCFLSCGNTLTGDTCVTTGGECLNYDTNSEQVCVSTAATYTCCTSGRSYSGTSGNGGKNEIVTKLNGKNVIVLSNEIGKKTSNGNLKISFISEGEN